MRQIVFAVVLVIVLFTGISSFGAGVVVGPDGKFSKQELSLPYAFYNESFGFSAGYVKGVVGYPQKQSTLLATAMAGSTGSAMGFLVGRDIQMPHVERLFLDPIVQVGYFMDNKSYVNGKPRFANERAGSNDSDQDNYVKGDGWDNFFRMKFKYLLPIGVNSQKTRATCYGLSAICVLVERYCPFGETSHRIGWR